MTLGPQKPLRAWPAFLRRRARFAVLGLFLFACHCSASPEGEMTSTLFVGNSRIDVIFESGYTRLSTEEVLRWVQMAAEAVHGYYGRFPVAHVSLDIRETHGAGVRGGMTFGAADGGRINIRVGSETSAKQFADDWMLTHEMIHLAFPQMADEHHWIEEGISTYVEPIARIRAGHLTAEQMWADVMRDMPQGLPEAGDRGLDHTHTWGRTYWGGAMFCLLADVGIRRETKNKKGLEDALRGILDAGGDIRHGWELAEALRVGDQATGTRMLEKLYEEMKDKPVPVGLNALWKELGVQQSAGEVKFDDAAKDATIRRGITSGVVRKSEGVSPEPHRAVFAGRTAGLPWGAR